MKRTLIALAVAVSLSGCGSGGGSRPSTLNFNTPVLLTTLDPSVLSSPTSPLITDLFARDINADGADEVIMAGRLSQPSTAHSDTRVSIFGFNTGRFTDETNRWFDANANIIVGSEPVVLFGNFTGHQDGKLDVLVVAGTDSSVTGPNVLFRNTGNDRFARVELSNNIWLHGGAVGDINGDGIDDVLTIGYGWPGSNLILGGNNPSTQNVNLSGSDVALGRFQLAGPTDTRLYAAVVDDSSNGHFKFYSITGTGAVAPVSVTIPVPDLGDRSHDIRALAINLDSDSLPDLVVISRPGPGPNGSWDESTQRMRVQFYRNLGNGEFVKDRESLVRDGVSWYNPVIRDINADGVDDIVLNSQTGGTTLLLGARDPATGQIIYAEAGGDVMRAFESNLTGFMRPVTIVKGPNGRNYLVGAQADSADRVHVFYSEIGSQGVYTVDSVVSTLKQSWPWLNDTEIQQILVRTGTSFQDGTVVDVAQALKPVGGIFMPTSHGLRSLYGSYSGLKISRNLQLLDGVGRNFSLNANAMESPKNTNSVGLFSRDRVTEFGHSLRIVGGAVTGIDGWWGGHDPNTGALALGKSFDTGVGKFSIAGLQQQRNPWLTLSGAWGTTGTSFSTEITWSRIQGPWRIGTGLMITNVGLKPGLITDITPMISGWAEAHYQLSDSWSIGSGIDPRVLHGYAWADLPTQVDWLGQVSFSKEKISLSQRSNTYVRLDGNHRIRSFRDTTINLSLRASGDDNHRASIYIKKEF